jgi:hypothetical protein
VRARNDRATALAGSRAAPRSVPGADAAG